MTEAYAHLDSDTLTVKVANAIAGSLGFTSKMPGTAYGIPAEACITGSKLHNVPDVCEGCYALKGNKQYVCARTARIDTNTAKKPGVVLALTGPRGGTAAFVEINHEDARLLCNQLIIAVMRLDNELTGEDANG